MDVYPSAATAAWLQLARVPGLRPNRLHALIAEYGSPEAVLAADSRSLAERGVGAAARAALLRPDPVAHARDLAWLSESGNDLVTRNDPDYPAALAACHDPPPLLFLRGCRALLAAPCIAVVGSRNPTGAGRTVARQLAGALAEAGLAVVSGLAVGIDGVAHSAALEVGGMTVAVTGNGLDRVYPAVHRDLARRVGEHGLLISEFSPGTPPLARHFPQRNRVISGLSLGVLVIEAALRSGSLITARLAADQGREVFAVPGALSNPLTRGCHRLIRDGATLVECVDDVLAELPGPRRAVPPAPGRLAAAPRPGTRDGDLAVVLRAGPASLDALVEATGRPAGAVAAGLLALELAGHVSSDPGGRYTWLPGSRK